MNKKWIFPVNLNRHEHSQHTIRSVFDNYLKNIEFTGIMYGFTGIV